MDGTAALAGSGRKTVAEYSALQREEKTGKAGKANCGSPDGTQEGVRLDITGAIQEMYRRQAEQAKEAGSGEPLHDIGKLMEVARRIARGDKVPQRDEKKLMEYSSDLYQMAKSAAVLNARKKHKKHKSLYKDEDESSIEEKIRELNREELSKSNNSL